MTVIKELLQNIHDFTKKLIYHLTQKNIMTKTPIFPLILPLYLKEAIERRTKKGGMSKWIIQAIDEKLKRDFRNE